jgi:hypothetical protein
MGKGIPRSAVTLVVDALAVLALLMAGGCAPAVAEPPAQGTGTLVGEIRGQHGSNVRLVYRTLPEIVERGRGWEQTPPGPKQLVRLNSNGGFSVAVPGCPAALRAVGCAGTTYEAWATFNRVQCSKPALMNVTTGVPNEVLFLNTAKNPPALEPLTCHSVRKSRTR